jgi:glucokinase
MHIIAADVGGTKTHLVYANANKPDDFLCEQKVSSAAFENFESLLQSFIRKCGENKQQTMLSLALPGDVSNGVARLTNLPWIIEKQNLMNSFGVSQVHFMNDFQASALGTLKLTEKETIVLNEGAHNIGAVRVVVGAGTGLGVAWAQGVGECLAAYPTEGGHIDFAPANKQQAELLRFLADRYEHVSYERILSGAGLVSLYEFLAGRLENGTDAAWVNEEAARGNEEAKAAMRMFVQVYGAYVGDLALMYKPEGGIYITGGVAAKMIDWMQGEDFKNAYLSKGRMQYVVENIEVRLVTNESIGVLGALSEAVKQQEAKL